MVSSFLSEQDVGQAILESYSRILESLAFTVMSRIEDVLYADSLTQDGSFQTDPLQESQPAQLTSSGEQNETLSNSMTLSDFMGWNLDQGEPDMNKKDSIGNFDEFSKVIDGKDMNEIPNIVTNKKVSYIEKLENLGGLRSPTARH